jgi:hypothetical protein
VKQKEDTVTFAVYYVANFPEGATGSGAAPIDHANPYVDGGDVKVLGNTGSLAAAPNFIFGGWNTESDGNGTAYMPEDEFVIDGASVALYAVWIPVFAVSYVANFPADVTGSGTAPIDPDSPYVDEADVTVLGNTENLAAGPNFIFGGWNTESDGSGTAFMPGNQFEIDGASVILYAVWIPAVQQVTLDQGTIDEMTEALREYYNLNSVTDPPEFADIKDDWYFDIPLTGVTEDYMREVTAITIDGEDILNAAPFSLSMGNNKFITDCKLAEVTGDAINGWKLRVSLATLALTTPDDRKYLVFTIFAAGYDNTAVAILVPEKKPLRLKNIVAKNPDVVTVITTDPNKRTWDVTFDPGYENNWRHVIGLIFEETKGENAIYMTKKDINGTISYGFTDSDKIDEDFCLGFYPPMADGTVIYTVATISRYGAPSITLIITGPESE